MKKIFTLAVSLLLAVTASASLKLKAEGGWNESAWMEFNGLDSEYSCYNGYVSADGTNWTKLDAQLVRSYGSYGRIDALGLKAGNYTLKVVPVKAGAEVSADAVVSSTLTVKNFNRSGYAYHNAEAGVGAYNNDGTLKSGARVLYVTGNTAKTVTIDMKKDKGNSVSLTGLQSILGAYEKGTETRPLAIRIIGTIKKEDMDALESSAIGLQVKGKTQQMNLTIEGVGKDATLYGFGILARNCRYVEFRNFAVMLHPEDGISFDTNNHHIWGHNLDIFYGQNKGGDKAKGDGSFDVKGTINATVDNNHYWDTGKCNLNSNGDEVDSVTYHHNWFDHSDSRHPRVRVSKHLHVYNNYYDGNAKYGIGATTGSCIFSENNYFRNCKYPMLISMQGSDINNGVGSSKDTKGTFSGETGGIIKAFGNMMTGQKKFQAYNASDATNSKHFDAYVAATRDEKVPAEVKTLKGETGYNNFDTESSFYSYTPDAAADVPSIVTGTYGAGRCQKGDFSFTFNNSVDDADAEINSSLDAKLKSYTSSFVKIIGNASADPTPEPNPEPSPEPNPEPNPKPNPGPTPEPQPEPTAALIDFPTSLSGITAKGTTATSSSALSIKNGYVGGSGSSKAVGNGILLKVEGGFKKGDIVTVAGNISVKTTNSKYDSKILTTAKLVTIDSENEEKTNEVHKYGKMVNTKESSETPADQTFTLGEDYAELWIIRDGGTTLNLTKIKVVRPDGTSTGIFDIKAETSVSNSAIKYDLQGREIKTPAKGKVYIMNGKKYIGK